MIITLTYDEFCNMWFGTAMDVADIVIANVRKKGSSLDPALDIESVKIMGVTYALEKAYNSYDVDHEKHANLKTYLSTLVRNCVLTELGKETTGVNEAHCVSKPKKDKDTPKYDHIMAGIPQRGSTGRAFEPHDYVEAYGWADRKEEVLKRMMQLLKKLQPVDQVILENWMNDEKTYLERTIKALNLEDTKRNRDMLSLRKKRALETLRALMGGKRPNYRDIYIPSGKYRDADGMAGEYSAKDEAYDRNFERRRYRAATAYITRDVDYKTFAENAYKKLLLDDEDE